MKRLGALPEKDDRDQRTLFVEGIPKTPLGTSRPAPFLRPTPNAVSHRHPGSTYPHPHPPPFAEGHKEVTVDDLVALFAGLGKVAYVRLLRDKNTKRITGTAFVEYETEKDALK